ncbi:uncharacterized protein CMU_037800 [Cryptosporidium muris RN66]|uniref:C2 domain-containing protein n=1 Tax=Cryptosporidium muris (strain RN66) TaxID=441375 RepID=B6A924_CRYMR|nr:uncharacterized protein CMU_037800 [Cryptosporidium muris RN66]EEA04715.1 hypothetical protein, conserved [Cryptosporidium muris RN66]|eukprot:XP_002139064.1 hypothetical protein [Cryptosporidium muris RN66]
MDDNEVNYSTIYKTPEFELRNPRVLAWSIIFQNGSPNNKIPNSPTKTHFDKDISSVTNCGNSLDLNGTESSENTLKRPFSTWRCLYWPEVAVNPIYSSGYAKMRIVLYLNKLNISANFSEDNAESVYNGELNNIKSNLDMAPIELLPYVRIYYDKELLYQSSIIKSDLCIILDIEVHHPLSNLYAEIYDWDNSDTSLVGTDDSIGQLIIPIGIHANKKALDTRLIVGMDDEARVLFIRKSYQKKVLSDNIVAQKLLKFPLNSNFNLPVYNSSGNYTDISDIIYSDIISKLTKEALLLAKNAEEKYKVNTGRLQNPHEYLVTRIYSEVKWSRITLIPREIAALNLPEPCKKIHEANSQLSPNINKDLNRIINSIKVIKDIFWPACIKPIQQKIQVIIEWESTILSFTIIGFIIYLLLYPQYTFPIFFGISLITLGSTFLHRYWAYDRINQITEYNLKQTQTLKKNLDGDIQQNTSRENEPLSPIIIDGTEPLVGQSDETDILQVLSSSALPPGYKIYLNKAANIFERLSKILKLVVSIIYWEDIVTSLVLSIFLLFSLLYSLFYPYIFQYGIQYIILSTISITVLSALPPLKSITRMFIAFRKYRKLKMIKFQN